MCGICGFCANGSVLGADDLARMNRSITHRGPDEGGQHLEPGVGLAMRRLSILDLTGSHQPLANEDESVWVVYNGEIYNYRQLREDLVARGHTLRTEGDTEVLVHLYEEYGTEMVQHLRGMFAFALWDRNTQTLVAARDRLGIKPLFWARSGETLIFGSEIKCIREAGLVDLDIDWQAVDEFLTYTYVPAPRTIHRHIHKLPAGHRLIARAGDVRVERYWDVDFSTKDVHAVDQWQELAEQKLLDAVDSHLVSDVPLGAFLSGGIDSSLVVAMMSKSLGGAPVSTFTMGFAGASAAIRDERPYARMLGDHYPTDHHEFEVEPDFSDILDAIHSAFDEPFADDSIIPTYYISKLTRQKVKVALSGLGGDELFGGYHRYRGFLLSRVYGRMPRGLHRGLVDPLVQLLPEPRGGSDQIDHLKRFSRSASLPPDQRYLGYVSSLDASERRALYRDELRRRIDTDRTAEVITGPFNACASDDILDRAFYTDLKTYLPDDILALSDRLSMWHSLEIRVPLIDHELTEFAARMPSNLKVRRDATKVLLRSIAEKWLPREIVHHRKQGFESPMAAWMRGDLREEIRGVLLDPAIDAMGLFDTAEIERRFEAHQSGRQKNNKILLSLYMLFTWIKRAGVA